VRLAGLSSPNAVDLLLLIGETGDGVRNERDANGYCRHRALPLGFRPSRVAPGGVVFHVLNRANGRLRLFKKDADYLAFERLLIEARAP
jgi:hypothetical protein